MPVTESQRRAIRDSIALVGRLSDGLVRIGPFSLGLEGILSWVPGIGEAYGALAGAFIVIQGARAGAPIRVLAAATAILSLRTVASAFPLAGPAFSDVFTAHKWAAALVVRALDADLAPLSPAHGVFGRRPLAA
jgi:hypothetical protein